MAPGSSGATQSAQPELTITRMFDGLRALVFEAWTDRRQVAQWWGPRGLTNPVCEMDLRPGGASRIVMRGPDGVDYPTTGVLREIVAPERLVFTNIALDGEGNSVLEELTTVAFSEHGGKTKLTLHTVQASAVGFLAEAANKLAGMAGRKVWTASRRTVKR